jgi:hypothetical protein
MKRKEKVLRPYSHNVKLSLAEVRMLRHCAEQAGLSISDWTRSQIHREYRPRCGAAWNRNAELAPEDRRFCGLPPGHEGAHENAKGASR